MRIEKKFEPMKNNDEKEVLVKIFSKKEEKKWRRVMIVKIKII